MAERPGPRGRLLVVCRANVCRSPTLGLLLGRLVADDDLEITTAGWRVGLEPGWCPQMRARVPDGADAGRLGAGHRPTAVDRSMIAASDLVLAADERSRAETARVAPALTARLFTAVEAAHLLAAAARQAPTAGTHLAEVAARLDALRGLVVLPEARPVRWPRRSTYGIDLPDPHSTSRRVTHERLRPQLDDVAAALAAGLAS